MFSFLAMVSLLVWLYLIFAHGQFWRADQRLKTGTVEGGNWPEVVAIIPARDEALVIGQSVGAHAKTAYPGRFSVIVVDDHSADGTGAIAERAGAGGDRRVTIVEAPKLETRWTGKLWALNQGLQVARETAPNAKYVLFTDADIVHGPTVLAGLVAKAENEDIVLVSLMALLDARGSWASLLIPAFVFFFQKLYPFRLVNDLENRLAGAAGGCVLIDREVLEGCGGLVAIKGEIIDDCALAKLIKGDPPLRKIWLGLTDEIHSLRDNRTFDANWNMVARTAFTQLNHSWTYLAGTVIAMAVLYLLPPLGFLFGDGWGAGVALAAWVAMSIAYLPTVELYGKPAWHVLGLPIAAALYVAMTVESARRHHRGEGALWKGRSYPSSGS